MKLPNRQSIRLDDYNYSQNGLYFITICTDNRKCVFDEYGELKNIVENNLLNLDKLFKNIIIDDYVIMPNHVHFIVIINYDINSIERATARVAPTVARRDYKNVGVTLAVTRMDISHKRLGDIIGGFKSICVTDWIKYLNKNNLKIKGKFWQRNYYEHIIRNKKEYLFIKEYIQNNPKNWQKDKLFV